MLNLKRNIADIKRLREIAGILFEEGFDFLLDKTNLKRFVPVTKKIRGARESQVTNEVRVRRTLERLGPTFIKFGQILSVRPDITPKSYIKELEKLQDNVAPFSFEEAKKSIEQSTGKRLEEMFKSFERVPVASASMAQVHKAVLKSGEKVAVKVKRPGIKEIMQRDIEIMFFIAELVEKHVKGLRKYNPSEIVEEFSEWTKKELNFIIETENIRRFYENFRNSRTTKIPKVYSEYSNEQIIVMEFIDGVSLHNIEQKKFGGVDVKKALINGFNSILEQVFIYGFFHADPHPSNIFVLKGNKIAFVDFGIVGKFDEELKEKAVDLFIGIIEGDTDKVTELLLDFGSVEEGSDLHKFKSRINDAMLPLRGSRLKDAKISKILEDVFDISLEFGVRIPREFVLFGKAIITIEGVGLIYYPDFRFQEMARPFLEKLIEKRYEPKRLIKDGIMSMLGLKRAFEKLPGQAARVLEKLEKGRIKIEMKDTDIERLSIELDKSSNRLTYGMIMAALLISGSLVINVGQKVFYGLPLLSLLCFLGAGALAVMLFISIINEKKL